MSPERARLADAIAARVAADQRHLAVQEAARQADEFAIEAMHAVDAARAAAENATLLRSHHLVAALQGDAGPAPMTPREARDRLRDAEEALNAARDLRDELQSQARAPAQPWAAEKVKNAALDVIRAEGRQVADTLATRLAQMQAEMIGAAEQLLWLTGQGVPLVAELSSALGRLNRPPSAWREDGGEPPASATWQAAFEALQVDPAAQLPE